MPGLVRLLLSAALATLPTLAMASPRSISDCERIEAADAYNHCLALFGPPARSPRLRAVATAELETNQLASQSVETPEPRAAKHGRSARRAARHASRSQHQIRAKRMVFSVVSDRSNER